VQYSAALASHSKVPCSEGFAASSIASIPHSAARLWLCFVQLSIASALRSAAKTRFSMAWLRQSFAVFCYGMVLLGYVVHCMGSASLSEAMAFAILSRRRMDMRDDGTPNDGYHSMGELYEHRAALFSALCNSNPCNSGKSRAHEDGSMFDGFFIAWINLRGKQVSYHCEDRYWDWFRIPEYPNAPHWDGYTSDDVITRLVEFDWEGHGKWR